MRLMLSRDFPDVFSDWLGWDNVTRGIPMAEYDVVENENGYELKIDLPGIEKKDIEMNIKDNTLSIKAERKDEKRQGVYEKAFTLPKGTNVDKIGAEMKNGVLKVGIPKSEAIKPKQIEIK